MGDYALQIKDISFSIGGNEYLLTSTVQVQWLLMIVIAISAYFLTKKLTTVPKGKQVIVEKVVDLIYGLVDSNMGKGYRSYAPYIGTLMIFILLQNITPLIGGIKAPTTDYSVPLALAIMTFVLIQFNAIKRGGVGGYAKGFISPTPALLPLNIIERVFVPVSLSLRLFGNITAAVIIMELVYEGLSHISHLVFGSIPVFAFLIPIPLHMFFDIFDGALQMVIFSMLTMIFIKTTAEH